MGSYTIYANKTAVVSADQPTVHFAAQAQEDLSRFGQLRQGKVLIGFEAPPVSLQFKPITTVKPYIYLNNTGDMGDSWTRSLWTEFNPDTVTFDDLDWWNHTGGMQLYYGSTYSSQWSDFYNIFDGQNAFDAVKNGIAVEGHKVAVSTSLSSMRPYLVVNYENVDVTPIASGSPTGGYVAKNKNNRFYWFILPSALCFGTFSQASAVFKWRDGIGGTQHSVNIGANRQSYEVPAGTFTTDTIQWQATITTNTGAVVSTPWYTISTVEPLSTATAVSPADTVVDGSAPTVFRWTHSISTGTLPTGADLQKSSNGSNWSSLAHVTGSATETTIPAGAFSSGPFFWRVRTYNQDGVAGEWSPPVSCIALAASPAPTVSSTAVPRPLVSWQAEGQQAAEVSISGVTKRLWGTEKQLLWPSLLEDGNYTVRVRVQNSYGLWSAWGETQIKVANVPSAAITLAATSDFFATLTWQTSGNYTAFAVYRNGVLIAVTTDKSYTDNMAEGDLSYFVSGLMADGNYTRSNAVAVSAVNDMIRIYSFADNLWLDLPLSDDQFNSVKNTDTAFGFYYHITAADYPVVELSRYRDHVTSFAFALTDPSSINFVRTLLGKQICVRQPDADQTVGVVLTLETARNAFYTVFSIQLQQIDIPEVTLP